MADISTRVELTMVGMLSLRDGAGGSRKKIGWLQPSMLDPILEAFVDGFSRRTERLSMRKLVVELLCGGRCGSFWWAVGRRRRQECHVRYVVRRNRS